MSVVLLSGGTGGAKLARGLYDTLGSELTVIANTGDDVGYYGAHISPDPDLITYWLADRIDERGWGIAGDTFNVMDTLRQLGMEIWFNLGDSDLAVCIDRKRKLDDGVSLSDTLGFLTAALGVTAQVVPMTDQPVHTEIRSGSRWIGIQEFLIRERGAVPIDDVRFAGVQRCRPAPTALAEIERARVIIIGPSNPVLSIGPILAVPGMQEALAGAQAPVIAVSPIVGGEVLKGPTEACLEWAGQPCTGSGVAAYYGRLLRGMIADESVQGVPCLQIQTRMDTEEQRRTLAGRVLQFAYSML